MNILNRNFSKKYQYFVFQICVTIPHTRIVSDHFYFISVVFLRKTGGTRLIGIGLYRFCIQAVLFSGKIVWKCSNKYNLGCSAKLHTYNEKILLINNNHNHPPKENKNKKVNTDNCTSGVQQKESEHNNPTKSQKGKKKHSKLSPVNQDKEFEDRNTPGNGQFPVPHNNTLSGDQGKVSEHKRQRSQRKKLIEFDDPPTESPNKEIETQSNHLVGGVKIKQEKIDLGYEDNYCVKANPVYTEKLINHSSKIKKEKRD